ncbi:L-ribulose-5-phosphate 4-epimerase AraD [Paractinoplanes durhamensis]|uniref:L-ribulose-5-phosphate 4-epimerase n=1 Tax=Paractinoplanes durhamensis TaxID=113563 RepID=A0ABQ3Z4T6_9ACTN|nr:L-ribulose-5-phosphate 4-epimerase AraD [Actinoplanes durhamensis]GIE04853.1 L-ribulose-5-phosphate 4-epimerase [Actinoplanes durhamensis]
MRDLLREVLEANLRIAKEGLATLTWGNVSGVDRGAGVYVIKPSGVPYDRLTEDDLVTVEIESGLTIGGRLKPSVDSETHRLLYQAFPSIGGITHTHSTHAVAFAQARRDIPVLGTTHADNFNGPIAVTRDLTAEECEHDYERNTGLAMLDTLDGDPDSVPAVLAASHGPFTWGPTAMKSLETAIVCEEVARMAIHTLALNPAAEPPEHLIRRHYSRKHGPGAYYGNVPDPRTPEAG